MSSDKDRGQRSLTSSSSSSEGEPKIPQSLSSSSTSGEKTRRRAPESTPEEVAEVLQGIPTDAQNKVLKTFAASISHTRSGLLPTAAEFSGYEQVVSGAGNRIIVMAENQATHRQGLEERRFDHEITLKDKMVDAEIADMKADRKEGLRGQVFALIVAALAIVTGGVVIFFGHDVSGTILAGSALGGIVTTFVMGRSKSTGRGGQDEPTSGTEDPT